MLYTKFGKKQINAERKKIMNEKNYAMKETENMICAEEMNPISESLTNMMNTAACLSTDALVIAQRINQHLFAKGELTNEDKNNPECFRDVLSFTVKRLSKLCEELSHITNMLGV